MRSSSIITIVAAGAVAFTTSGPAGAAEPRHPGERAACIAQAWVPANTDPETEPGFLAEFISTQAQTGEWGANIRQQGCKS